jgi:hypothetical protein
MIDGKSGHRNSESNDLSVRIAQLNERQQISSIRSVCVVGIPCGARSATSHFI